MLMTKMEVKTKDACQDTSPIPHRKLEQKMKGFASIYISVWVNFDLKHVGIPHRWEDLSPPLPLPYK
jgi:hypothetical protein